jgi:hypothetical protein
LALILKRDNQFRGVEMKLIFSYSLLSIIMIFIPEHPLPADNYLLDGYQSSTINYKLIQKVTPTSETATLNLSFVVPQNFSSSTYNQQISDFKILFSQNPQKEEDWTDKRGNQVVDYKWLNPRQAVEAVITFRVKNSVLLKDIISQTPFPPQSPSEDIKYYLKSTKMVQSNEKSIRDLSDSIVAEPKTVYEAVHKILSWVIDHVNYILDPEVYDALSTMTSGRGNCQNFSHLAAALMRAQGIPVRIVNGITLKEPYDIRVDNRTLTLNMAQGRHSWIEVYFSDLGWMPYDPQQSELFVSNRFIRIEHGLDNEATLNDGLVRWTRTKGSKKVIEFQEGIEASFQMDEISISGTNQKSGPKRLLLMPGVKMITETPRPPVIEESGEFDPSILADLKFNRPFIFGNLEFPQNVNFAFTRVRGTSKNENVQELKKNFLVETAEYVSGGQDYAQLFQVEKPIYLEKIDLALQKFGGHGYMVLELHEDKDGKPGTVAAESSPVDLLSLAQGRGYDWIEFDFSGQQLVLTPDDYWLTIRFDGSPIINWFYSYGKPVGPIQGTLMKSAKERSWKHTMGYEFNYRIVGKVSH